jgi:3-oxoacyl-[acyl-carrier protein] reductase
MNLGLNGRCFIVSGGSRGLGRMTAEVLVSEGANVVIGSRGVLKTDGESLLGQKPDQVHHVVVDLSDPSSADELVAAAKEKYGRLDGALISVGGPPVGGVFDIGDGVWRSAFETVFLGPLRLARAVATDVDRKAGSIVFVLSTSARSPIPGLATSNGLRPGLAMLTKQMADELGPVGIRVNALLPGRIATERVAELDAMGGDADGARVASEATIPLRRYGKPTEFARVATFLLSQGAAYVTGALIPVDGGASRAL